MPRTRWWGTYPVNRLFLTVGFAAETWLVFEGPFSPAERGPFAARLAAHFGLDAAVQAGLLTGYSFHWSPTGRLKRLRLVPHPRVRRTPGLSGIRRLFHV